MQIKMNFSIFNNYYIFIKISYLELYSIYYPIYIYISNKRNVSKTIMFQKKFFFLFKN